MQVANMVLHNETPFDHYQKFPGWSYSAIKQYDRAEPFVTTGKMQLGTLVHQYLLEPSHYNHEHRAIVIPAARAVKETVGDLLPMLSAEVSVTADFIHDGFVMGYRGRVDMLRAGRLVIDLKVSEVPLVKTIGFFGYDRAISGYCLSTGSRLGIVIRVCPRTFKTEKKIITPSCEWWEAQVLRFGSPLKQSGSV